MASGRARMWMTWGGRLAALVVAIVIPACQGSTTGNTAGNSGLLWQSQAGQGTSSTTGGVTWVDPNSGLGAGTIGVIQIIASVDDATYGKFNVSTKPPPFNLFVAYIYALEHPLSTDTGSITITSKESELLGHLNGYRNMVMGNQVGAGGGIVVGGGSVVLPSFNKGTKAARAHCKHYAYFHGGGAMPGETVNDHPWIPPANGGPGDDWHAKGRWTAAGPPVNAEGDHVIHTRGGTPADQIGNPGMLTPLRAGMQPYNIYANQGRLGKLMIDTAPNAGEFSYSGVLLTDAIMIRDFIINDDGLLLVDYYGTPAYPHPPSSHICVGYWAGGARANYWNILLLRNPNPAN